MSPLAILEYARELGLTIDVEGNRLAVAPAGRLPPDFAALLVQHKKVLLGWLNQRPCPGWRTVPPHDLPLNPIRPSPSIINARAVMQFVVRQIGDTPGLLCEWCLRRELSYWTAHGWPDHVCAYAAARDAATWQLNRNEAATWELLQTIEESASTAKP